MGPFLYHLGKCGVDPFKTSEHSEIHTFFPHNEEDKEGEEDEEKKDLIETNYTNGTNEVAKKNSTKSVLYVMKQIVFMLSDNVVISVFVGNVIQIKVILIY